MRFSRSCGLLIAPLVLLLIPPFVWSQSGQRKPRPLRNQVSTAAVSDLLKSNEAVIRATQGYRDSLERLLEIYERHLGSTAGLLQERQALFEKGYVSKKEVEEIQERVNELEVSVNQTRQRRSEAETLITESQAWADLLKGPPLRAGGYRETTALIRFDGRSGWSLADAAKISAFFAKTFGRPLPVSALGQTAVHDRMKFDHRDAMDVALHPDSPEGTALIAYLRKAGIPFLAFRGKLSGSATGAHIHIGRPSLRNRPL
ncbi:MAG: hypothetical protein HY695_09120 [Deltaproteobacteria bacterium]|nr:hypothetical protein [Deltaproteobacteria bacterium]